MNFRTAILVFFCVTFLGVTTSKAQDTNTTNTSNTKKSESRVITEKTDINIKEKKVMVDAPVDKIVGCEFPVRKSEKNSCHQFLHFENKRKDVSLEIEITELRNKKRKLIGVYKAFPELSCEVHNGITQGNYEYKIFISPSKTQIAQSEVFIQCNQVAKITIPAPTTAIVPSSNQ